MAFIRNPPIIMSAMPNSHVLISSRLARCVVLAMFPVRKQHCFFVVENTIAGCYFCLKHLEKASLEDYRMKMLSGLYGP